jgi:hypothetical protein
VRWTVFPIAVATYGNNSVRLTYADRNDTHTSYLAGSKLQQTKRLNNIITYANDNSLLDRSLGFGQILDQVSRRHLCQST